MRNCVTALEDAPELCLCSLGLKEEMQSHAAFTYNVGEAQSTGLA